MLGTKTIKVWFYSISFKNVHSETAESCLSHCSSSHRITSNSKDTDYQKHYESAHMNVRDSIAHKSAPVNIFTNYVATQLIGGIISGYVCYDCNRYRLKFIINFSP